MKIPSVRSAGFRLSAAVALLAGAFAPALRAQDALPLWRDPAQPAEARVAALLKELTLEEKARMVHGTGNWTSGGVPRLGVPEIWMDDGPLGVRAETQANSFTPLSRTDDAATAMPATLGLAATWNTDLAFEYGAVIGREAFRRGKNIMLGPSLNIQRTPLNGRNFEYLGEDPFLTSRIAVGYIKGQASEGITGTAKHFAANNQETNRNGVDARVDERTLREIYLPAFKAAVQEGGVLSVMGAYNFLNGEHASHNQYLLVQVLRNEWGFKGLVESDWGGVHDTKEAVFKGMDIEMPGRGPDGAQSLMGDAYLNGLKDGTYPMATLDEKVTHILYAMVKIGMLDTPAKRVPRPITDADPLSTKENQAIARRVAEESMVLLKNNGRLLPLDAAKIKTIAVIGDNAQRAFSIGGGSAQIKSPYEITALDGIKARAGAGITVSYARGYVAAAAGGRGRRGGPPPAAAPSGTPDTAALAAEAVAAAKAADVVIYVGGLTHESGDAESGDRADLKLPFGQDALLAQVLAANPRTVVVLNGGGALEMPWVDQANALLYAWYGGLENGNAMARLLFGDVSPSGKLPNTFPKKLEDTPTFAGGQDAYPGLPNPDAPRRGGGPGAFPGAAAPAAGAPASAAPAAVAAAAPGQVPTAPGAAPAAGAGGGARGARGARGAGGPGGGNPLIPSTLQHYSEKLLVGYRWYDTKKIEPLFPFGFGLSYTTFAYSNLRVSPGGADGALATVQFDVTNTGTREAAEVAQLYVHQDRPALERPEKELKGFQKITLKPNERQTVRLALKAAAFAYYDPEKKSWVAEAGAYQLLAGGSSRDVPLRATFNLTQPATFKD